MKPINKINKKNFERMFNLIDILDESVFYPAAGKDWSDIECLSNQYCSFIHVDYSLKSSDVRHSMIENCARNGYDLIRLEDVSDDIFNLDTFYTHNFKENEHEKIRLENSTINERFSYIDFELFALWAVYELNPSKTENTKGKASRFSLLHIGAEACATFDAIYLSNKINPKCIAIIDPGEGYGDNWTMFTNPEFRLYKSLCLNTTNNQAKMPTELLTNRVTSDVGKAFWPNFKYKEAYNFSHREPHPWIKKYSRMQSIKTV
jgi:hypothetical protein